MTTSPPSPPPSLLSVDEARAVILQNVEPVSSETAHLVDASRRVLAETLKSSRDIPGFDNSAMDGVGVRVDDVKSASASSPVSLKIVGTSLAGAPPAPSSSGVSGPSPRAVFLAAGSAVRIMTGAPIPLGVEAIVMRENTDESDIARGVVGVLEAARAGQHVRRRGEDVAVGDVVARAGDVVTPARLNLLLSAGHVTVRVHRRVVVGVLASGDELREPGTALGQNDVVNSNAHAVAAAAGALGCEVHLLGIAGDSLDDHVTRISAGLFCDALITIGGVSLGTHDFTRPALEKIGASLEMWRVAMRPGKPVAFGKKDRARIFGLPGNPVSALVSFELFVRPALMHMAGIPASPRPVFNATLVDGAFTKKAGLEFYARGVVRLDDGGLKVRLLDGQGSHHVSALAKANALVRFAKDVEQVSEGARVDVLLLDDPLTATA